MLRCVADKILSHSTALSIEDGRHPTVEHALKLQGRPFIANSLEMSHPSSFVHCLTGPVSFPFSLLYRKSLSHKKLHLEYGRKVNLLEIDGNHRYTRSVR